MSTIESPDVQDTPVFHTRDVAEVLDELGVVAEAGLDNGEAEKRLESYGPNELVERDGIQPLRIFFNQFTDTMVIVLMIAAVIAAAIGDTNDAIVCDDPHDKGAYILKSCGGDSKRSVYFRIQGKRLFMKRCLLHQICCKGGQILIEALSDTLCHICYRLP